MKTVIFACIHNAGRSQMAAAFFNRIADSGKARAVSAGTKPANHVHPEVVTAMREIGIDLAGAVPRTLTAELADDGDRLVTMGCGDTCPYVPGVPVDDWPIEDPKGKTREQVRGIRDGIRERVEAMIENEGWGRAGEGRAGGDRGPGHASRDDGPGGDGGLGEGPR